MEIVSSSDYVTSHTLQTGPKSGDSNKSSSGAIAARTACVARVCLFGIESRRPEGDCRVVDRWNSAVDDAHRLFPLTLVLPKPIS